RGTLTALSFCAQENCADGAQSLGALFQTTKGSFFGATFAGGDYNYGTVFRLTPNGTLTTLYSFCAQANCPDGGFPSAGLVQATDGNLYGTTYINGSGGVGTIFRITPYGTLTTLYT